MTAQNNLSIGRWGNSLALRIPKPISEMLGLSINDLVEVTVENGKLVLTPARKPAPRYTLAQLLSATTETGKEVSWGKAVGKEI